MAPGFFYWTGVRPTLGMATGPHTVPLAGHSNGMREGLKITWLWVCVAVHQKILVTEQYLMYTTTAEVAMYKSDLSDS